MLMECKVVCKQSLIPVTSLEFCSVADSRILLAGEGPYLKLFSQEGSLLVEQEVLPSRTVHGIRVASQETWRRTSGAVVLVFGQKAFTTVEITHHEQGRLELRCKRDITELSDWILDACLLAYEEDDQDFEVAAVTAHNALVMYSSSTGTENTFYNECNCILYSARLLGCNVKEGLVIASGTVFNQILLWHLEGERLFSSSSPSSPSSSSSSSSSSPALRAIVQLFLSGHEGVIFSVRFSCDETQLVSASDDRTIRVWNLPSNWKALDKAEQCSCALVLYGHTARVWDARLLPECLVSIGEDTTCRVWDLRGQCVDTVEGHRGKSIWSLAIDAENSLVATGGGDCSIRVFTLKSQDNEWVLDSRLPHQPTAVRPDSPRSVQLCGQTVLCLTNDGYLYATVTDSAALCCEWTEIHHDSEFSGYSIMTALQCQQLLALGNLHGYIKLLKLDNRGTCTTELVWQAHDGKVFSLTWTTVFSTEAPGAPIPLNLLFSCGSEGELVCWNVDYEKSGTLAVSKLACFSLPPSKHRWVSSVLVLPDNFNTSEDNTSSKHCDEELGPRSYCVICGDRKGSVHVYRSRLLPVQLPGQMQEKSSTDKCLGPFQSLWGIHGPNGVTCVTSHNGSVFTAGRDGYCRQFSLDHSGGLTELTKFKPVKGMDWIEQLMFMEDDLLVLGFHTTDLVLFSRNQNKHIMKISCGGGHRSYGFSSKQQVSIASLPSKRHTTKLSCIYEAHMSPALNESSAIQRFKHSNAIEMRDGITFNFYTGTPTYVICTQYIQIVSNKSALAVYIKQSVLCLRKVNLHAYFTKLVLQQAFVGREALSLEVLYSEPTNGAGLIAVGSEDCTICLLAIQPLSDTHSPSDTDYHSVRVLTTLQGHISSVKALSSSPSHLGSSCKLLFSGGARASLKVWLLTNLTAGFPEAQKEPDVTLKAELYLHDGSSRLRKRQPKKKLSETPPECRIMSLTSFPLSELYAPSGRYSFVSSHHFIAAGCSDGMIRSGSCDKKSCSEHQTLFLACVGKGWARDYFLYCNQLSLIPRPLANWVRGYQQLKRPWNIWQYIYQEEDQQFHELQPPLSHTRCVTAVEHFIHQTSSTILRDEQSTSSVFLLSSATDGRVTVWSLEPYITGWIQLMAAVSKVPQDDCTVSKKHLATAQTNLVASPSDSPVVVFQAHQSGINDIAISSHVSEDCYTIATVGDDNAVVMTLCKLVCLDPSSPTLIVEHQFSEPSAHSSSITGVKFLHPDTLVTTSVDQRINVWQLVGSSSEKLLRLVSSHFHDVADTAALQLYHTKDNAVLLFCGVGFQYYSLQCITSKPPFIQ